MMVRRRKEFVEAFRWSEPKNPPPHVENIEAEDGGEGGAVTYRGTINTPDGQKPVQLGDWILNEDAGPRILNDEEFQKDYEVAA